MITDTEREEFLAAIRKEVCAHFKDRPPEGPPCAPLGKACGVDLYLPELVEAVREVQGDVIEPYRQMKQRLVCAPALTCTATPVRVRWITGLCPSSRSSRRSISAGKSGAWASVRHRPAPEGPLRRRSDSPRLRARGGEVDRLRLDDALWQQRLGPRLLDSGRGGEHGGRIRGPRRSGRLDGGGRVAGAGGAQCRAGGSASGPGRGRGQRWGMGRGASKMPATPCFWSSPPTALEAHAVDMASPLERHPGRRHGA